ncbi:hypothetical protein HMPREF0281_00923 [Corynebacterium ammoniagenes DSM 20306]|uniref:Secreted protein n=2 Tax=Corynebacterium ammoniagenes TaxID=1697 RepID=A0ABN0AG11_CORAM|nr:hypothetical protein HMPREF0281_00923 [Corynebacterium ammoniagenes DSM 20306]
MAYMGRILILLLIIAAVVLVWKAFGPSSWNQKAKTTAAPPQREIKGPDDDENFLWELEKEAFKQRRERERAAEEKRRPQSGNRKDLPDSSDDTDNRDNPDNRNNPRSED